MADPAVGRAAPIELASLLGERSSGDLTKQPCQKQSTLGASMLGMSGRKLPGAERIGTDATDWHW